MTRKHFERVAAMLKRHKDCALCAELLSKEFAEWFAEENPRFDRDRFMEACGFGDNQ